MKKYMPLNGLRWSRDSGSALCGTPPTDVLGQAGGGGYVATCWMYTQISQIKLIHNIKHTRRCNCKQQKRKRLKSHYIACNTDVSHIIRKMHVRQKPQNTAQQPEDDADACTSCVPQSTYNLPSLYTTLHRCTYTPPLYCAIHRRNTPD